jgi:hypothetical protein
MATTTRVSAGALGKPKEFCARGRAAVAIVGAKVIKPILNSAGEGL